MPHYLEPYLASIQPEGEEQDRAAAHILKLLIIQSDKSRTKLDSIYTFEEEWIAANLYFYITSQKER